MLWRLPTLRPYAMTLTMSQLSFVNIDRCLENAMSTLPVIAALTCGMNFKAKTRIFGSMLDDCQI
ncbi:hypothetical protein F4695_004050 [Rhizobium soli]|uniref:Uncharacterized protein n=1 Tax=Rhizobium soli TaxID=424798 RepID=A0A7X0JN64_9HYPH|nr:hypothetical protein [Rhizobium soli]